MNRQYTASSPYSLTPTERLRTPRRSSRYRRDDDGPTPYDDRGDDTYGVGSGYGRGYGEDDTDAYPRYADEDFEPAENYDEYLEEARIDRRWMWIAGTAGAVLFVAVIIASTVLSGGDSGSVSATVASSGATTSSAPEPSALPSPRVAAPPTPTLPAETVTTVTPPAPVPVPVPAPAAPLLPAPQAAPPPPAAAAGTVTYHITGNRQLLDLVTVIYTDERGALQTDINAALPWSKTVVLDPGVTLSSVTATSVAGQLNCSIVDATGAVIAAQVSNSIITNCTR